MKLVATKKVLQKRLNQIKYNYLLLFHLDKIEIPNNLSEEEKEQFLKKIYKDKAKIHERLGAKKFQKFVKKVDKAKFKFVKQIIKEDRMIRWSDKVTDYNSEKMLKKAKTEDEKKSIIENMKRAKVLVRKQLKEQRSINYYQGVDNRTENFYKYLNKNKEIHKNSLKINGLLLVTSIGLGVAGVPILPVVLGSYQVLAGFKNLQCINAQNYYLSVINSRKKALVKRNLKGIKKIYEENKDLITDIKKGLEEGKDLYKGTDILDSINTVEGLKQLKKRLVIAKERQETIIDNNKLETKKFKEEILEKLITPPEGTSKGEYQKVAVKR